MLFFNWFDTTVLIFLPKLLRSFIFVYSSCNCITNSFHIFFEISWICNEISKAISTEIATGIPKVDAELMLKELPKEFEQNVIFQNNYRRFVQSNYQLQRGNLKKIEKSIETAFTKFIYWNFFRIFFLCHLYNSIIWLQILIRLPEFLFLLLCLFLFLCWYIFYLYVDILGNFVF